MFLVANETEQEVLTQVHTYNLTNIVECDILMYEKRYEICPYCGKKLFRIVPSSEYKNIYVWCKTCKKEILINKRAKEPIQ